MVKIRKTTVKINGKWLLTHFMYLGFHKSFWDFSFRFFLQKNNLYLFAQTAWLTLFRPSSKAKEGSSKSRSLKSGLLTMPWLLDTVQDFLIKLGIKPCMHILKKSIFSLDHVIVRPTKIMNTLLKVCKMCAFKVIFWHQKPKESFRSFFLRRIFD